MPDKLVLLADLGTLKAYKVTRDELNGNARMELVANTENLSAHQRLSDTLTDQAGRFSVANGIASGQMSHGENHNLKTENEKRQIEHLSEQVNSIVASSDAAHFFFAAPAAINQRVLDGFRPEVRAKMQKNVTSDLVKIDKSEVLARFQ